jgi:SAM-dependent methyltransferase
MQSHPASEILGRLHGGSIYPRRVERLSAALAPSFALRARVLDVGSGDGHIASRIAHRRPDIDIQGIDVLARPKSAIPVKLFDGTTIPFADGSFDSVMFVDVLHHTDDPAVLLREARRVARGTVVIKDHLREGFAADATLRLMDWVGNARHGVRLPYNYWSRAQWIAAWTREGLAVESMREALDLYPWPLSSAFDRSLHFVAVLSVIGSEAAR